MSMIINRAKNISNQSNNPNTSNLKDNHSNDNNENNGNNDHLQTSTLKPRTSNRRRLLKRGEEKKKTGMDNIGQLDNMDNWIICMILDMICTDK